MKLIQFKAYGPFATIAVLKQVTNVKVGGMLLDEMRKRVALSRKLDDDKAKHAIVDEDEFKMLAESLKAFPFGIADEKLLALIDDVLESKEPPVVMLSEVSGGRGQVSGKKVKSEA